LGGNWPIGVGDDGLAVFVHGNGDGIGGARPAQAAAGKSAKITAIADDGVVQLVPRGTIHLVRHDAEIETDIDKDGTDRAVAVLGSDLLERGRAFEGGLPGRVMQPGGGFAAGALLARLGRGHRAHRIAQVLAAGGEPAKPFFERSGAEQGTADAGEDQREITRAEDYGDVGEAGKEMRVGGVLAQRVGEIPAVGDERVEEGEEAADARRQGPIGGTGVEGGFGW